MEEESKTSSDEAKSCPRGHWRPAEDEKLRQLVEQFGPQNWNSIAEKLQGRSGKKIIAMPLSLFMGKKKKMVFERECFCVVPR